MSKRIAQAFVDMHNSLEESGLRLTSEAVATLVAAEIRDQPIQYSLTLPQANAILDMDCIAWGEGQGPETQEARDGWCAMVGLAKILTDRKASWRP